MIIYEFSKFLQKHNDELITHKTTPLELLPIWIKSVINKNPKNNIEKIIHKEITFCQNETGDCLIVGNSDSGRILVKALIEFAASYDNYNHAKWLEMAERAFHNKNNT